MRVASCAILKPGLSFAIGFCSFSLAVIAGGYLWRGNYFVQLTALVFSAGLIVTDLLWRGAFDKVRLPKTGLEVILVCAATVLLLSWVVSPDPRQGLERISLLVGYGVSFYILVDVFEAGLDRRMFLSAFLWVSGACIALAALETYSRYLQWWQEVQTWRQLPPFPYRFVSLLGHSNALMALANLGAPLALTWALQSRRFWGRLGTISWLVFYFLAIPFSSSRGGWLGVFVWVATLVVFWARERGVWGRIRALAARRTWFWGGAGAVFFIFGFFAYRFWLYFSAHPSHGANPFGGREEIWANAWKIIQQNLWLGAGPGRFAFEYLAVQPGAPPAYWPSHAHNLFLQVWAESGVIAVLASLGLCAALLRRLWMAARLNASGWQKENHAILAAVLAWLAQNLVDDLTHWPAVMLPLVILAAFVLSQGTPAPARFLKAGVNWLWLPALALLGSAAWQVWAYQPMAAGLAAYRHGEASEAARLIDRSAARDPSFPYYSVQSALAWSRVWGETQDLEALAGARAAFTQALEREAGLSLWWANLAVLDWQAGERAAAVQHMERAMALSPRQPAYPLNLGWMMEQEQQLDAARLYYQTALELNPFWSTHPFWRLTSARQAALQVAEMNGPKNALDAWPEFTQSVRALEEGDFKTARRALAEAAWRGLDPLAVKAGQAAIAEAEGEPAEAIQVYNQIADMVPVRLLQTENNIAGAYSLWINSRQGLDFDLVPGFIQLEADVGQYAAQQRLFLLDAGASDCHRANVVWLGLQKQVHGGAFEALSSPPPCP